MGKKIQRERSLLRVQPFVSPRPDLVPCHSFHTHHAQQQQASYIASGSYDQAAVVWDAKTGQVGV